MKKSIKISSSQANYIGRFAPSPTGSLHMGSLLAAMASYCDAIKDQGQWLVRIEDLDPPREIKGASQQILMTLKNLGLKFEQSVVFQSQRQQAYENAINKLEKLSALYYCNCSRTELKDLPILKHKCRNKTKIPMQAHSIKVKVPDKIVSYIDKIQGNNNKNLLNDCGDFTIKRQDGLYSYQLAVVVDDAYQEITHIVRGTDLIESTPWQIYLQSLLGITQPIYTHIPILVNSNHQKLSKQTFAKPINNEDPLSVLLTAYSYFNQQPFQKRPSSVKQFWQHAIKHWNIDKISKVNAFKV